MSGPLLVLSLSGVGGESVFRVLQSFAGWWWGGAGLLRVDGGGA